ncbi:MAG: hypothetical protein ABJB86_06195 [Bacteroidota bacterium]
MKKKLLTLIAFAVVTITSAFAGSNDISKNALTTFSESFAKASNVKWEKNETYDKVSFQLNGQSLSALLSEEGKLIAVSRNILSTELPIGLQTALDKSFSSYWISDLAEYSVNNETIYYMTIENADEKTTLESIGTYDWSVMKKTVK